MQPLLDFLEELDSHKTYYRLDHQRDAIMVIVDIPGERWEIEFFANGEIEAECFKSDGVVDLASDELLKDIVKRSL